MDLSLAFEQLADRGAQYGIPLEDMLTKLPDELLLNPTQIPEFLDNKHISHIIPQSMRPDLIADPDNWFFEDAAENIARGSEVATDAEVSIAEADNSADVLDGDYDDNGILDALEGAGEEGVDLASDLIELFA